jgi:regulator of protease activity HflC (stomatin/prohibitin superfamily)
MELDEVFANKDAIASAVTEKIKEKMESFGWRILQALVTGIDPDNGVKNAMNAVESANRDRAAAQTRAEANKFVLVKAAEAEAESKALQGQGIARQRAAIVQGLRDSIGQTGEELDPEKVSELLLITQYFDTLEKMASSRGQVIFVPHSEGGGDMASNMRDGILQAQAGKR